MSRKHLSTFIIVAVIGFGVLIKAQDLPPPEADGSESSPRVPVPEATRYKFSDAKEALQILEQVTAANEAILGKQRETLSQLESLAEKAQSAKSSAARSAEKK